MEKERLKQTIVIANKAYREGKPTMSDSAFDDLVEQYRWLVSEEEFSSFRDSLHEVAGKTKHPYVMGSLNKLKAECRDDVLKFIRENVTSKLNISAKVDGISCRLHYSRDGKLVSASTRGDGYFGEDLTSKISFVSNVMQEVKAQHELDIRGELVILKRDFEKVADKFANPRNATAGIMNKKDWTEDELKLVTFVPYTVLGSMYAKSEQFIVLEKFGFKTAWHVDIAKEDVDDSIVDKLLQFLSQDYEYEVDGLVLSDACYVNEDKYRPDKQVAFKANQLVAITTVVDISFEGPSKDGQFIPVAVLEPVELGGSIISRATCHNLRYLAEKGIKYGSIVKLLKSGDIIPKIVEVIDNSNATDIELPDECPCCGAKLVDDGLNLKCTSKTCTAKTVEQVTQFIKKLGCKHASNATLEKLGILSFEDLVKFMPDKKRKTEAKLYDELAAKVFTRSRKDLLAATNFTGLSEKLVGKIVDFYGFDSIEKGIYNGLPDGVGELTLSKFKDDILDNLKTVDMFLKDARYNCLELPKSSSSNANGMSVCFTGKLNTMSRSEASKVAEAAGYEVKNAVTKGLTYLVTNDADTNSSKGKNARKLGVNIVSEEEFLKMCSNAASDIMEL